MAKSAKRLFICLDNGGYEGSLERLKIYVALPDAEAARTAYCISVANTRDTHNDSDSTISAIPPLSRVCVRTRYGIAGTNRIRVISDGTPKRFGGPQ
jgi:hypothetical protein